MAGADSVEKLEDVIVRSAEQVAGQIKAAKEAAIQQGSATEKRGKPFWTIRPPKTPALPF